MMESDVLKFICANQGAVDTDYLMLNLGSSDLPEIISNQEKFAMCCPFGQPKVVARTRLRLCRAKDCNGSCGGLHLCKNFLFSGSCHFHRTRRGCNFSHELDSDHNRRILREHELGGLSRAELCTLMLQSDHRILPPICHDYNNGDGEFGNCQDGSDCKRLHICEKYMIRDCTCYRTHDLKAPQPLKYLHERGVPDDLIHSLKSVYANIQALWFHDRSGKKRTEGGHQQRGSYQGNRGNRGNRGSRGNRGNQGYYQQLKTASSTGDIFGAISVIDSYDSDGSNNFKSSTSDISAAAYDTDTSSEDGHNQTQTTSRGRGGNRGNRGSRGHRGNRGNRGNRGSRGNRGNQGHYQQLKPASSTGDILNDICVLDLHSNDGPNKGDSERQQMKSSHSDIFSAANMTDDSSDDGQSRKQIQNVVETSTVDGRDGNLGNQGNHQQLQKANSYSDILAAIETLDLYNDDELDEGNNEQQPLKSSTSDFPAAANMTDASMDESRKQTQNLNKTLATIRGRGGSHGNRGNRSNLGNRGDWGNNQQLRRADSIEDIFAAVKAEANSDAGPRRMERQRPVKDKTEICMYFIKGNCKHGERCFKAHDEMPYRWEVREGDRWNPLPDNEMIEKDYCDPKNSYSSSSRLPVYFDTMTCGSNKVRRLSTINSLTEPTFILTTKWIWYWEDEFGRWNMFASADGGCRPADMDSSKLEQRFLENDKDVVEFTAGLYSYSLSFQDMIEINKQYGTKRLVKRRPLFVSEAHVQAVKERKPLSYRKHAAGLDHSDKTQIPSTGYRRVPLQRSSDEFMEIEALFCKTMRGFDIVKIERIQNKALWEVFQLQKTLMKNSNGGFSVREQKLFRGADNKHVDIICRSNFDWKICGTHGMAYGRGSYFARDAKYSHSYTGDSYVKSMFISRLLVGDYTKGSPDYRRPPSKDGGSVNSFDSCVDDVMNPSIFVVFEKDQIYPEYLLQYKTAETNTNSESDF